MNFSLKGKVALITGASRGIGEAVAMGLAEAGADLAIASRKLPDLEKVAEKIRKVGRKCLPVAAHVGRLEEINNLVSKVVEEFGRIDILVNNAGTNPTMAQAIDADERAWDSIRQADLVIFLTDAQSASQQDELKTQILKELPPKCAVLELVNKADLLEPSKTAPGEALLISAKTGAGIEQLKGRILELVGWAGPQEGAILARRRHLDCIERAAEHIEKSEQFAANGNNSLELFAEELSLAQRHLGEITGKLLPDDLLGKIFSQFCIGK